VSEPTIFISIAAYRDPELIPTLEDCLARAAHPERLRFGICWQHGDEEAALPFASDPRFRILDVDWKDSRGACWARAEVMKLYAGEDYFMQIDSHHRFAERWDERVLAQLEATGSEKPLLTAYATPFNPSTPEVRDLTPMQMNFDRFTSEAIVLFRPGELRDWQKRDRPMRGRFVSAHFLFTIGAFVDEVPYDPELYFIGEEITMTVRAFTHGYDIFHPTEIIVWHEYTREYREHKHWSDHEHSKGVEIAWHQRDRASLDKVRDFLSAPHAGPFGLGEQRTFAEYEQYAGLNFRLRRVQEYTRQGFEPPNPPAEDGWAEKIRTYALDLAIEKSRLPADVADYHFWYVGVHDAWGQEIYRADADRREVATLLATDQPHAVVSRQFETDRIPATWTVWPVSDSKGWLEKIEGPVLSLHPPVTLVTALLDIGRESLSPAFSRSFTAHYVPMFERLLQSPLPMVIYIDPRYESVVWKHRDSYNTKVVLVSAHDLEQLPWYLQVQQIRQRDEWRRQAGWLAESPQAALPHYNPLVLSKMRWLDAAASDNPFNAEHLYWIDAGITGTVSDPLVHHEKLAERLTQATSHFLWIEYPYRGATEIHGFPRRELSRLADAIAVDRVARGGFFGGTRDGIRQVAADYSQLLAESLSAGLMGTEESLFTILAYRKPEQFSHYLVESSGLIAPFFDALLRGRGNERLSMPAVQRPSAAPLVTAGAGADVAVDDPAHVARGATTVFGLPMMQNRHAVLAFSALFDHLHASGTPPARIIELGSGMGGLSVLLHAFTAWHGGDFITYDQHGAEPRNSAFARLGVDFRHKNFTHEFVEAEIAREIQKPGLSVVLCDGADKGGDVTRFAEYLKEGDLIGAHDYAADTATFATTLQGRYWNWCEVTDADLAAATARWGLEPVLADDFARAAWTMRRKTAAAQRPALIAQGRDGSTALYVLSFNAPAQLAAWFASVERAEPRLLASATTRVVLDNSTDRDTEPDYAALCARYGFEHVRRGNLGILGGRSWCARHFASDSAADFMLFFEDDMLLHTDPGVCRNGFPTVIPEVVAKAVEIIRNEPSIDFLKLSYTEFYGDHTRNWAFYNLPPHRRDELFPDGNRTSIRLIKSHAGLSYALGEIFYSNWPMLITRRGNDLLFMQDDGSARFEQTLMVRALELARAGQLQGGVLLASPINHDRQVHYPAEVRKES
jgi:hypothetical protein